MHTAHDKHELTTTPKMQLATNGPSKSAFAPAYRRGDAVWIDLGAPECPSDFTVGVISKIRPVEARDDDGNPLPPKRLKTGPGSAPNGATSTAPI